MRGATNWARALLQALVDAVVPDACHLCGRPHDPTLAEILPPARYAAAILSAPQPAGAMVHSHPVCACCLGALVTDGVPGPIGWWGPGGRVVLASGESFGAGRAGTRPLVALAPFRTGPVLLEIVHRVKFGGVRPLLDGLAAALARCLADWPGAPPEPTLVPVPMGARARRRRGFNQADELARGLARATGWPVAPRALARARRGKPQSLAPRAARAANARAAFTKGREPVAGRRVLLVDDLITTGCTAAACASLLLAAGAREVAVVGVGRAV